MIPPTLIMILVGFRYIENPAQGASPTGVVLSTPEALTDTRVVGALALTISFAIATSIVSRTRLRIGHAIVIALMVFVLTVRMFGFAMDGTTLATGTQKVKTFGEILFLILNSAGFFLQSYLPRAATVQR
jgi:hypothetical protein